MHGDGDDDLVAAGQVAADDAGADQVALLGEARRRSRAPSAPAGRAGAPRPIVSEWARPPMALMSERFCGGGPVPDVGGLGPVAAEVLALDEQVGRDHDVTLAHPEHRRVVAGADQHLLTLGEHARSARRSAPNSPTSPSGGVRRERHGLIPPDRRRRRTSRWRPVGAAGVRGRLTAASPPTQTSREIRTMVVQAYILIQTDVGKAAEVATRDRPGQGRHAGRGRHRSLRRDRARRGPQRRRARQAGGREGADPRRHHPHAHLPGGPHLTWPEPTGSRAPGRPRPGARVRPPASSRSASCSPAAARSRSTIPTSRLSAADQARCQRVIDALPERPSPTSHDARRSRRRRWAAPGATRRSSCSAVSAYPPGSPGAPRARRPTASAGSSPTARSNDQSADVVMATRWLPPGGAGRPCPRRTAPTGWRPPWSELAPMVKQYTRLVHPCH